MKTFNFLVTYALLPKDITVQQTAVLSHLLEGRDNAEIAAEVGISIKTVKHHITSLLKHYEVVSRTQLVKVCMQRHISHLEMVLGAIKDGRNSATDRTAEAKLPA